MMKLTYFNFGPGGRAFMVRAALHHAGIKFDDIRLSPTEFKTAKQNGKYQTGIPELVLPNGKVYTQSLAMLRFAGKLANIYPTDEYKAFAVDVVCDTVHDLLAKAPGGSNEAEREKNRQIYSNGRMKAYMESLERTIQQERGKYTVGDDFTIADLDLYFLTNMISSGKFDYIPPSYLNTYPNMVELNEIIAKHPICTNWMSEVMATSGAKL